MAKFHRHHKPVIGHRFSLGCINNNKLLGVAIVGRHISRFIDYKTTVEVLRLCTDGSKNVCSKLYSACRRAARELGYQRIITYILESENGISLKASGWQKGPISKGGSWNCKSRKRVDKFPTCPKRLYQSYLIKDNCDEEVVI